MIHLGGRIDFRSVLFLAILRERERTGSRKPQAAVNLELFYERDSKSVPTLDPRFLYHRQS